MSHKSFTAALFWLSFSATLGLSSSLSSTARSQPDSPSAVDLHISPRFDIDLNTSRSGDRKSFGEIGGFFPLFQQAGHHLTYLNTIGRVDTSGNLGGSVSLGHRLSLTDSSLLGGYVAYDIRDMGEATFNQLGLGAEVMGQDWAAYLNGYLPVGKTRNQIGESTNQNQIVDAQFQGSQLLLTTGGIEIVESALGRIEAGGRYKLGGFGRYGDLWGLGSAYYIDNSIGGSLQLEHQVGHRFRLSLGAQSDGIFGTQVFASIGTSFGGTALSSATAEERPNWRRIAASSVSRTNRIVVRQEARGTERDSQIAVNPETGQAYDFRHVTPNADAANQGDGSAEQPFTTLGSSRADTENTGLRDVESGEIVYVRAGDSRERAIAPFTIPEGVQIYSDAFATVLPTQLGDISLPGSGTGIRPLVSGTDGIALVDGNNRVSGFDIEGATNGISLASPIGNVVIENNLIRNASNRAFSLAQSSDTASISISNNVIETAANDGIRVEVTDTANLNLSIDNNQISDVTNADGDGIDIEVNDNSRAAIAMNNNRIDNAGNSGIELETCGDTSVDACNANFTATVAGNTVSNSGGDGILFFHNSNLPANLTIENNKVQQSGVDRTGVALNAGNPLPAPGNGGFGIAAITFADGDLSLNISNNTVVDSQDEKIAVINNLENNTASSGTAAAPAVDVVIEGNALSGSGEGAIAATDVLVISGAQPGTPNAPSICLALQENSTEKGYFLANGLAISSPVSQVVFSPGTFEQTAGNSRDRLFTEGSLTFQSVPLNALGPVTLVSAGDMTDECELP